MRMTREQVERLLERMDELAYMLYELGLDSAGKNLLGAIEQIDQDLEGVELEEC